MTNHLLPICICLVGLVLLAGCTGAEPAPRPLPPQEVQPVEDAPRADDERASRQPVETQHLASVPPDDAMAPNASGMPQPEEVVASHIAQPQASVEPNTPTPDEEPATTVVEPNEPAVVETEPQEPNEATVAQGQATDLPVFVREYTQLLRDHVHEDGGVDYAGLYRRRLDVKRLLMRLGELDPNAYAAWPDNEKLAFWINAYNLKMLEIITRNYPIQSSWWLRLTWPPSDVRHIPGIWSDYKFLVMDEEFTLTEVERRFFHRTFNDPRAYLAITYAGRSSPTLRRQPYQGADLDRQLDEQVKTFLTAGQGLRIDRRERVVYLSALFKPSWRGKEFLARFATDKKFKDRDPETRAVLSFLTGYLSREDAYFLETENYRVEYTNFDWRLNDISRSY